MQDGITNTEGLIFQGDFLYNDTGRRKLYLGDCDDIFSSHFNVGVLSKAVIKIEMGFSHVKILIVFGVGIRQHPFLPFV